MKFFKTKLFFILALFISFYRSFETQVYNPSPFGLALATFFGLMFVGYVFSFRNKFDDLTEHQMAVSLVVGITILCTEFYVMWLYVWRYLIL